MDRADRAHLVWVDDGLFHAVDGLKPQRLASSAEAVALYHATLDPDGRLVVAWSDQEPSGARTLHVSTRSTQGAWAHETLPLEFSGTAARLVLGKAGRFFVWTNGTTNQLPHGRVIDLDTRRVLPIRQPSATAWVDDEGRLHFVVPQGEFWGDDLYHHWFDPETFGTHGTTLETSRWPDDNIPRSTPLPGPSSWLPHGASLGGTGDVHVIAREEFSGVRAPGAKDVFVVLGLTPDEAMTASRIAQDLPFQNDDLSVSLPMEAAQIAAGADGTLRIVTRGVRPSADGTSEGVLVRLDGRGCSSRRVSSTK